MSYEWDLLEFNRNLISNYRLTRSLNCFYEPAQWQQQLYLLNDEDNIIWKGPTAVLHVPLEIIERTWIELLYDAFWNMFQDKSFICCQQLHRLGAEIQEWSYSLLTPILIPLTKVAFQELGWDVIPYPPYSPKLAPPDFHLLRSSNNLYWISLQSWSVNSSPPSKPNC